MNLDLHALPKAELHCHLDGLLDPPMARAIRQDDPAFPIDPETFARAFPVQDFESFVRWWTFIDPLEGDLAPFYPILGQHMARLKAQNVRYAEFMIASGDLPGDTVEAVEKVMTLRAWASQQEAGEIQVEFLVAFGRSLPPDVVAARAERVLALHEAGLIVGVALAGLEQGHPVRPFRRTFARLREAGLGIEIHAGEWVGPESVWDALQNGYPDRLGHAVSLFQDAALLDVVRGRGVHLEMCPTSNVKTGSVRRIEDHPIRIARELGLNFSVNTDDPGPFECSLASEYALLAEVFGFDEDDFRQIYANALAARFQPALRIA